MTNKTSIPQFETLSKSELQEISGGKSAWDKFINWWMSPQGRAVDKWYWENVQGCGGTSIYYHNAAEAAKK